MILNSDTISRADYKLPVKMKNQNSIKSKETHGVSNCQSFYHYQDMGSNRSNFIQRSNNFGANPYYNQRFMPYYNQDYSFSRSYFMPIHPSNPHPLHTLSKEFPSSEQLLRSKSSHQTSSTNSSSISTISSKNIILPICQKNALCMDGYISDSNAKTKSSSVTNETSSTKSEKVSNQSCMVEKIPNSSSSICLSSSSYNISKSNSKKSEAISHIETITSPPSKNVALNVNPLSSKIKKGNAAKDLSTKIVDINGSSKSFPRVKRILKRIESDKDKMSPHHQFENRNTQSNRIISFEKISSYYPPIPLNQNKRGCPSVSSSSVSSSPETVPSITDEGSSKEKKRPKISHEDQLSFSSLDTLCEAVTMVTTKQNEEKKTKHLMAMKSLDKSKSCSCPRSRCIKLYCECFQEGRMCSSLCSCKKCKNTKEETGPHGLRTKAINSILSRNPHAFMKDSAPVTNPPQTHDGIICRCVKSQCLKLYCDCFQSGQVCGPYCMCINCLNTNAESGKHGKRTIAKQSCLQRNPDAFTKKVKEPGSGCSCKNSRCLKKYCDCFNNGLPCSSSCTCKDCANLDSNMLKLIGNTPGKVDKK